MPSPSIKSVKNLAGFYQKRTYLLFSLYFLSFGILVAIFTSFINYQMQVINIDESLMDRFEKTKNEKIKDLNDYLSALDTTLFSAASNPITQRYLDNPSPSNREALQDLLLGIFTSRPAYMQIRLLNASGTEAIRIDRRESGDISVIPPNGLQNKSERYYFQETARLDTNTFWHSKLDLNIENNEIEMPIRPTFRLATPLKRKGVFYGILIINANASNILKSTSNSDDFTIFMVDHHGEILHHPDPNRAWSRYIPNRKPFNPIDISSPDHYFTIGVENLFNNHEKLKLIMEPKQTMLDNITKNNLLTASIIAGIVLVISIPLSWLIALFPARLQKQLSITHEELARTNQLLDKHVITSHSDASGVITDVSSRMCEISQYAKEELVGHSHSMLKYKNANNTIYQDLWTSITAGKTWSGELHNQTKSGKEYWVSSIITPEYDNAGKLFGYVQISQEITAKKTLEHLSVIDPLTQIFNRLKLDKVLSDEMIRFHRYQLAFSIILIDLDHFKSVNDTWGHQAGDDILVAVAKTLNKLTRAVDYAGRWGGEEFLVICPNTDLNQAAQLASTTTTPSPQAWAWQCRLRPTSL
jgi:PAS domain S-box-containing protein